MRDETNLSQRQPAPESRQTIRSTGRSYWLTEYRVTALAGSGGLVTDDDDVAALLAADLESLTTNLLVRDRVLRTTLVTFDSHDTPSTGWLLLLTPELDAPDAGVSLIWDRIADSPRDRPNGTCTARG